MGVSGYLTSLVGANKVESVHVVQRKQDAAMNVQHRGIAFILMRNAADIDEAIQKLNGYVLGSRDLRVKRHTGSTGERKVFVFNLDTDKSKEETETFLRETCQNASLEVESLNALPHKGYGFIILKDSEDIPICVTALNGKEFGRNKVSAQKHNRGWDGNNSGQVEQALPATQTNTLFVANIANIKSQAEVSTYIEALVGADNI